MRLRRRSSTSGPSKGKGAPQISRGMTRPQRVALGDNSRYLRLVLGDYKFSHDPINSQNRQQIFNRINDIVRMFARLLCGSLERHVFPSVPYFIVTLCNIVKEISPLLLRKKIKNSEKQSFSKNFNFCTQLREIIFLFRILSAMIIKIATYRIYPAYRRCNYRVYRPVRFAHLSGLLFRGRNPSRIR